MHLLLTLQMTSTTGSEQAEAGSQKQPEFPLSGEVGSQHLGPLSLWDGIQTAWETAATSTPALWLYSCLFHTRGVFIWCQGNCNRRVGLCVLLFLWVVHGSDAYHLPSSGGGWWRSPGRSKYTYRWLLQPPCMLRRWKLDLIMKSLLCVHSLFMLHLPLNVCVNESL